MQITTFVVGAGASREFGIFNGETSLAAEMAKALDLQIDMRGNVGGEGVLADQLRISRETLRPTDLGLAARHIRGGLVTSNSVDEFLENQEHDAATLVGKLTIAHCIRAAEEQSNFNSSVAHWLAYAGASQPVGDNLVPGDVVEALKGTWLGRLFRMLTAGISRSRVATIFDGVRFVCFNYDRCIETYFYYALRAAYPIEPHDAAAIVAALDIVHPYGTIGEPGFIAPGRGLSYGQRAEYARLDQMAQSIRTFAEQKANCPDQDAISHYVNEATVIAFLGFGFHQQNMDLLRRNRPDGVAVFATAFEESASNQAVFRTRLVRAAYPHPAHMVPSECSDFIKNYGMEMLGGTA